MVDATISWLGCAVWRVWAASNQPLPEEHDLVASTNAPFLQTRLASAQRLVFRFAFSSPWAVGATDRPVCAGRYGEHFASTKTLETGAL
jgi:hypothetical protein